MRTATSNLLTPGPLTALAAALLFLAGAPLSSATPPPGAATYSGAGTVVTSVGGTGIAPTILDNGAVTCELAMRSGTGGACLPFAELQGDSVYVHDDNVADADLAFQVCIDNNGDGICVGERDGSGSCSDVIFFSHETGTGVNHNPLWVPLRAFHPV